MKPALVGFSQHEGAESAHWGDSKLRIVAGTHPVVYPALGSHANYYNSALHLGRSAAQGVGCDDTSGPSTELRPRVALVPSTKPAYLRAYPWLGYEGNWGEEHQSFYNGPTGANTKLQWTQPITWAKTEWHDNSFIVPAGGAIGTTATGFFCGVVGAGSGLLTALVRSPSPFYVALALLLILILWLSSRTQWQPSAPLRLERRRPWGAMINATRRMYFGHLRRFLAIGLLFIPLGLLITGIQYLVFRVGGFNGLVNSAGSTNAVVDFLAFALGIVFTLFGLSVVVAATAVAMVAIDAGGTASARAAYRRVLPELRPLLGVALLAAVVIALVSLTSIGVVLSVWLLVRWAFLAQVVVLERRSGRSALRRSSQLVRNNWWRVASLLLFVTVIALLVGPLVGTMLLFVTSASFNFINLASSVVYVFVLPYAAITMTYMYFDLRVSKQHEDATAEAGDVLPVETPPPAPAPP
jgi:glycerophosphoryl diester phosphodiesterase family protein